MTANSNSNTSNEKISLEEQLQRAETAVRNNEFKVVTLHKQWKTYLTRLSIMVIMIALHQMQSPSTACLKDVKAFNEALEENEHLDSTLTVTGFKATLLVLTDCMVHILGIGMATLLATFLQSQPTPKPADTRSLEVRKRPLLFADARYMLANACLPPLLALYFGNRDGKFVSCLDPKLMDYAGIEATERQRSLPIVVVFHVITTACLWFMDMQQSGVEDNLTKIDLLRIELLQAQQDDKKNKNNKKKNKSSSSSSSQSNLATIVESPDKDEKKRQ